MQIHNFSIMFLVKEQIALNYYNIYQILHNRNAYKRISKVLDKHCFPFSTCGISIYFHLEVKLD